MPKSDQLGRYLDNFSLKQLANELTVRQQLLAEATQRVAEVQRVIASRVEEDVRQARKLLGKYEGVVRVAIDGCEVVSEVPRDVKWDQKALEKAVGALAEQGVLPDQYLKYELSVGERVYANLPEWARSILAEARTIKHGREKITVNVVNGAR
jgi:hypothetical protein